MGDAIVANNLGKRFHRYHSARPVTLMEAALKGWRRLTPVEQFWALRAVSFTVAPGEMLGVIGHNGAGKSTLLQLLGGVASPNEGRVRVQGRIGALLDLGAGLHGDLTGRENAFTTAIVAGLTRRDVARRFDQLVEFAELEAFIDNPVRTYSTGMMMRLAFSVAVHTDPQVLLIDEFLSVGDLSFQSKCIQRIMDLKAQGCAIVFISHDAGQVQKLCDRALWLSQGLVVADGPPDVVVGQYVTEMRRETQQLTPVRPPKRLENGAELQVNQNRFGSLEIEITQVHLTPPTGIAAGDGLRVDIAYDAPQPIQEPIFSITLSREDGQICFDTNTANSGAAIATLVGRGQVSLRIDRLDLNQGRYFVDVGIYHRHWQYTYDYHWHVYPLEVRSPPGSQGILHPPCHWRVGSALPSTPDSIS